MLALEKWGEGRFKPLVMFAHTVASSGEDVYDLCNAARQPKVRDFLARVEDKPAWLENYVGQAFLMIDPRLVEEILAASGDCEFAEQAGNFLDELRKFVLATPEERKLTARKIAAKLREAKMTWEDLLGFVPIVNEAIDEIYEHYLKTVRKQGIGEDEDPAFLALMQSSKRMRFFLLVAVPCWFEFGKSPTELFNSAQSGDFKALRMLLNLDQLCLCDPKILEQFHKHMESNKVKRAQLAEAMKYKPLKKFKRKAIKVLCAALVYKITRGLYEGVVELQKKLSKMGIKIGPVPGIAITFSSLRRLFDAIYRDSHDEPLPDPDFSQPTPDAFVLSVKRASTFWAKKLNKIA